MRAQVTEVCHGYCLQVWKEALNFAEVDATLKLRNPVKVLYLLALREITSSTTEETTAAVSLPVDQLATTASQVVTQPATLVFKPTGEGEMG